ncbi:MAG: hypothetical protein NVSMB46_06280 [Candidatus Saccharimonadales bacterium]
MSLIQNKIIEPLDVHLDNDKVRPQTKFKELSIKKRIIVITTIVSSMISSIVISWYYFIHNSIRLDEAQSLWQTSHSLTGTLKVVAQDVHVPLYHLLLHFWQLYVGADIVSARLLSLLFFILTIPIIYLLARTILSVNWSLLVVVLFSMSPFLLWYANEARMYTLLVLITSISQYYYLKLIRSKGEHGWLGYSLSAIIGVYSHYFFLFNLLTQGLFYIFNRKNFIKGTFKKFTFLAIALVLELSPWLYYFYSLGLAQNTSPHLHKPSTVDLFNVFSQFSFGFQTNHVNTILVSTWPIFVIIALLAVKRGQKINHQLAYVLFSGLVPVIIAFLLSYVINPFFLGRYMAASLAPLLIVVIWFISNYRPVLSRVVSALLIIIVSVALIQQSLSPQTPVKEDYRSAAQYISTRAHYSDTVVLSAPFTVYPFEYYYSGHATIYTLPLWDRTIPGAIPSFKESQLANQVNGLNSDHQYTYLLLSFNQGYENTIFQYYEKHFQLIDKKQFSADLNLYVYRVGYNMPPALGKSYTSL